MATHPEVLRLAANPMAGVCYSDYDPTREGSPWLGPPGTAIVLTRDLEKRLNFTTELVFSDRIWGVPLVSHDETSRQDVTRWEGIVGKLVAGEADWSPCEVTLTLARYQAILYSHIPQNLNEMLMFARVPPPTVNRLTRIDTVLLPFDTMVWLYTTTALLLYSLITNAMNQPFKRVLRHLVVTLVEMTALLLARSRRLSRFTGKTNRSIKGFILLIWIFPATLLSILYENELFSYLTNMERYDLIDDWAELQSRIDAKLVMVNAYANSAGHSIAVKLFGEENVKRLTNMDDCVLSIMNQPPSSDPLGSVTLVWTGEGRVLFNTLSRLGVPDPASSKQVYIMGKDQGMDPRFIGYVFSRKRSDLMHTMQPWLMSYLEFGHITHWDDESTRQLVAYHRHDIRKFHLDPADYTSDRVNRHFSLSYGMMSGSFVVYALFGSLACFKICIELIISHNKVFKFHYLSSTWNMFNMI